MTSDDEYEPGLDYDDDEFFFDEEDEEDDWRLRPEWLHADCLDPSSALDMGTCCKYPANPLVSRATALADSADRAVGGVGELARDDGCAVVNVELARLLVSVPGLLAQIHAVLPGMSRTSAAQLTCPVARLDGVSGRRDELEPLHPLLEACAEALWAALAPRGRGESGPAGFHIRLGLRAAAGVEGNRE